MTNKMYDSIRKVLLFLPVSLLLAACSQDEIPGGDSLPEGKYPLEIASVTMSAEVSSQPWGANAPQTRVHESDDGNSSEWNMGEDIIGVCIGNGNPGKYVVTLSIATALTPCYWASTSDQEVTAWYPFYDNESGTVELADQSEKLVYVLKGSGTGNYNTGVNLSFSHALAKVRVVLEGDQAEKVTDVKIKSFTQCTHTRGTDIQGSDEDWITMKQFTRGKETVWEANVVPGYEITDFRINGTIDGTLKTSVSPKARMVNTITLTVDKAVTEIKGGETITQPGDYIIRGNFTESITLNSTGINLTLDNVQATTDDAPIIIGNNAQVTLNISGTANSLTSKNGNGIEIREGASLSITGNGMNSSKLVVNASDNTNPGMDLRAGIGPSTGNVSIKTINISNVHLVVSGGRTGNNGNGPAAIGLCSVNGEYNQSCDGISITDSKIEATSYGGACIGTGSVSNDLTSEGTYNLGPITITSSQIKATANQDHVSGNSGACIGFGYIGADANGVIEKITITKSTLDLTVGNSKAYKIGRGNKEASATYSITNGIIVDGQNKGSEGWNP